MFYALNFALVAALFFLVADERSSGLPTRPQINDYDKKDLTEKEKEHIRGVLELALKELKDEDILRVLKESLTLRFSVCFSPFPHPQHYPEGMPDGVMQDDGFSPEQKKGLRELLLEALDLNEEEILDFLKSSIQFRIQYCTLAGLIHETGYPLPQPDPQQSTPSPIAERTTTTSTPGRTTESSTGSNGGASSSSTPAASVTEAWTENQAGDFTVSQFELEPTSGLPSISQLEKQSVFLEDEPSRTQAGNDSKEKLFKRRFFKSFDDMANPTKEMNLENDLNTISEKKSLLASSRDKPSEMEVVEGNPAENLPKRLQESQTLSSSSRANHYANLAELGFEKNLSNFLVSESNMRVVEEPEQDNDQSIMNSLEEVGKEALQHKEQPSRIMEANSDKGEFASVMRIDYNALARDREKPGIVGVDLGLLH